MNSLNQPILTHYTKPASSLAVFIQCSFSGQTEPKQANRTAASKTRGGGSKTVAGKQNNSKNRGKGLPRSSMNIKM